MSPHTSSNLPESRMGHTSLPQVSGIPIWSCSRWGFPCHDCYQSCGALLPHHFTLTYFVSKLKDSRRYIFCGTFRRLSPPRHYLAPCPMEPGLSSLCIDKERLSDRLCLYTSKALSDLPTYRVYLQSNCKQTLATDKSLGGIITRAYR